MRVVYWRGGPALFVDACNEVRCGINASKCKLGVVTLIESDTDIPLAQCVCVDDRPNQVAGRRQKESEAVE